MGSLSGRIGLGAVVCLTFLSAGASAHEILNARGVNPFRNASGLLPGEYIDPLTGGLSLTQVDLALPGPAGFDLVIQRSYSSKFRINPGTVSEYIDSYGWTGVGWTLHMGRVRNPLQSTPGPVEMPDGSLHHLYPRLSTSDGLGGFITKGFWIYDKTSNTLRLPNGTKYIFGQLLTFNALDSSSQFRYATRIEDAFGNPIVVNYVNTSTDVISNIVQTTKPGQTRTVTFAATAGQLNSMSYAGRTWTYTHSTPLGWRRLTAVRNPVGVDWTFAHCASPGATCVAEELTKVTTPNGGEVSYEYSTQTFKIGNNSNYNVPSRAVKKRSLGGRDVLPGVWDYLYGQSSAENQTLVTDPAGKTRTTFIGVGVFSQTGDVWSIGLPHEIARLTSGGTTVQLTTNTWQASAPISALDVTVGLNFDLDVHAPLLESRSISIPKTPGADTLLTEYFYNAPNFNDFAQPWRVRMTSNRGGMRTTEFGYRHDFTPYIRGRQTSETVCAASTCTASNGFPTTWTYSNNLGSYGFLTSKTSNGVVTEFTPTAQGDVNTVKVGSTVDGRGQITSFTYDWGREKDRTPPIASTATTRVINPEGTVASETRRLLTNNLGYDDLFRLTTITPIALPTIPPTLPSAPTTTTYNKSGVREDSTTTTRGLVSTTTLVDGFGRARLSTDAVGVKVETTYDSSGRRKTVTLPYEGSPSPIPKDTFTYDSLDRLISVQHQDSSRVGYEFNGLSVTIRDEEGKATTQHWEAFGSPEASQLAQVTEPNVGSGQTSTFYEYDALGNLTQVNNGGGLASAPVRTWLYYAADESRPGLLKAETHPESGTTVFTYDSAGNLETRTNALSEETTHTYDGNNRLTKIDPPGAAHDLNIGYDESDNRTSLTNSFVSSTFTFDGVNRLTSRSDSASGRVFVTGFEYDSNDRLRHITYPAPSGRHVWYSYDKANRITQVANAASSPSLVYANDFLYHPSGAIKEFRPNGGSSPKQTFTYHPTRYWLGSVSTSLRSLSYSYDNVGNVESITDPRPLMSRSFTYDDLHRLRTASGVWGSGTFTYDVWGNRTNDPTTGTSNWLYDSQFFRLTRPSAFGSPTLSYNSLGNLTSDPAFTYTYTPDNLVETVKPSGGSTVAATYRYDGDGQRLVRVLQDGSPRFSIRGAGGQVLSEFEEQPCGASPNLRWIRDSIYAGGRLIAALKSGAVLPSISWSATSSSVNESDPSANVMAVLTTASPLPCPVTVSYTATPGAAGDTDLGHPRSGVLTFAAGSTSGTTRIASIPLEDDLLDEADESFAVTLSDPNSATIGANAVHTVSIVDNDPLPGVSVGNANPVAESSGGLPGILSFPIMLSSASGRTVSVSVSTAPGTASEFDYVSISGKGVTFDPGETVKTVLVTVVDDLIYEPSQSVLLNVVGSPINASLSIAQGSGVIQPDGDAAPGLLVSDGSTPEGNSGTKDLEFVVSLSAPSEVAAAVNWSTADGTATVAGSDYIANSGLLNFPIGQTSQQVFVTINGDLLFELNETFLVTLSAPAHATITDGQGIGTIVNDDAQTPIVTTGAASGITESTVMLSGSVNPNGLPTTGSFEYGPTAGYGSSTTATSLGAGVASTALNVLAEDLACNTLFHFRAVAVNSAGSVAGSDNTFTTAACPPPPVVTTLPATQSTQTGATVHGMINPNGGVTRRRFEYGLTTAYGSVSPDFKIGAGTNPVAVSFAVNGLACNTLYHYRATGQNGGGTVSGGDLTWTTAPCPPAGSNNIGSASARALLLNSVTRDTLGGVRAETWYRVRLFAARSYQFSAWPADHEQGIDAPAIGLALFSADGTTLATPAPTVSSGAVEGSSNANGDALPSTLMFEPGASGVFYLRVLRSSGGAVVQSVNVVVRETTLFSPWASRAAGYEGFIEMHNNTGAEVSVTLRGYNSAGVLQGGGVMVTLPPEATVFRTAADIGVPIETFAGVVITHSGAHGAISANLTTLNGATGLSFDSPFTVRDGSMMRLPVR